MRVEDDDPRRVADLGSDSSGGQSSEAKGREPDRPPRVDDLLEGGGDSIMGLMRISRVVDHDMHVVTSKEVREYEVHLSHLRLGFVIDRDGASLLRSLLHLEWLCLAFARSSACSGYFDWGRRWSSWCASQLIFPETGSTLGIE